MKLCVATRIHGVSPSPELELKLSKFIGNTLLYSKLILIAIKVDLADTACGQELYRWVETIAGAYPSTVVVVPISEWGPGVTPALNALLQRALTVQATHILYQSLEVLVSASDVDVLCGECGADTLVVGARMGGHVFEEGKSVPVNGRTVPWNTLALWDAATLAVTGFPMVADGLLPGTAWGVEEVSAVVLAQLVSPGKTRTKLITLDSVEWSTSFSDPARQAAHERKMESKVSRPATHMQYLPPGAARATVEHLVALPTPPVHTDAAAHFARVDLAGLFPLAGSDVLATSQSPLQSRSTSACLYDQARLLANAELVDSLMSLSGACPDQKKPSGKRKTVLVTGGAGFIGSHTTARLLMRGDDVVVVDEVNNYYSVAQKEDNLAWLEGLSRASGCGALTVVRGDVCDEVLMRELFESRGITHVVHLAARAGVRPSIDDPLIYVHSNVRATTCLLELARQFNCQHFVYASSSSVYGDNSREVFNESDRTDKPVSPYAATKKACELMASAYTHLYKMPTAGLRFFTVYGPRGRPDMAPYLFLDSICHGRVIKQFGDGSSERDYTYIDDIVAGVLAAVDNPHGCRVYNLGNGRPIALRDFISLAGECVGRVPIVTVLPPQPGDVGRTCADISEARELLGYSPQVPFEEGLRRTAEWFRLKDSPSPRAQSRSNSSCSSTGGTTPPLKLERNFLRSSDRHRNNRDTTSVTGNRSKGKV